MACYKLGFEEFIIMNKMFGQIFVFLDNLMCYVVVFIRDEILKKFKSETHVKHKVCTNTCVAHAQCEVHTS